MAKAKTTTQRLKEAPTLDALSKILNGLSPEEQSKLGDVLVDLPTFGGPEPRDTKGVWSWDKTRLLVSGGGKGEFRIEPRVPSGHKTYVL